ncbi:MAG: hypothetical protein KDB37_20775 [Ilumatobacter sp.]|nr:hypothetical protein [Ilumatobacter sp.]
MKQQASGMLRAAKAEIDKKVKAKLDEQAQDALRHIRDRTLRGIGVNDRRFEPYRPSVAKRKGRTAPVTLRQSYEMMNSLYVRPGAGNKREILFRDRGRNERIGRYHQTGTRNSDGSRRMAQRRWFGLTLRYSRQAAQKFGQGFEVLTPTDRRRSFKISLVV